MDYSGGMLAANWEDTAERLINITLPEEFAAQLQALYAEKGLGKGLQGGVEGQRGVVLIARDTRPHSEGLMRLACRGVDMAGGIAHDLGIATTPQLHYAVARYNQTRQGGLEGMPIGALLADYYNTLSSGFNDLLATADAGLLKSPRQQVTVDCANGVGSVSLLEFIPRLKSVDIDPRNEAYSGPVNDNCGAEHCQKLQLPPASMTKTVRSAATSIITTEPGSMLDGYVLKCSLDGDADRIVFHTLRESRSSDSSSNSYSKSDSDNSSWLLLDGDKIACLVAYFIGKELTAAGLIAPPPAAASTGDDSHSHSHRRFFKFGVVQTAYANGASTTYLRAQGIPVLFAKTGVKFCHKVAHEAFDCGVYFEANGHGTALFSQALTEAILSHDCSSTTSTSSSSSSDNDDSNSRKNLAFRRLQATLRVLNQVTGDAISDMLLCLAVLQVYSMSLEQWNALYSDLPSRQIKCQVSDKSLIRCSDDEMRVVQPVELQERLDASMLKVERGRCFIRPSGTEDVVRIYAEAQSASDIAVLVEDATRAIKEIIK